MNKYQIIKRDGEYIPGMLIPYFWTWVSDGFSTLEEAKVYLFDYIKEKEYETKRSKREVVFKMESEY